MVKSKSKGLASSFLLAGIGVAAAAVGFLAAAGKEGAVATGWGTLAGVGCALILSGAIKYVISRKKDHGDGSTVSDKRARLQGYRARLLWVFPVVAVLFLFQSTWAAIEILAGRGEFKDYLGVLLPVLYAWVVTMIVLGWDWQSRTNRSYMEDELVLLIRAKAMTIAGVVLMAGLTVACGLGLWRAEIGVLSIPFVLIIGAASAGIRFAWLDREAGQDG